jgi:hypothetical protein
VLACGLGCTIGRLGCLFLVRHGRAVGFLHDLLLLRNGLIRSAPQDQDDDDDH